MNARVWWQAWRWRVRLARAGVECARPGMVGGLLPRVENLGSMVLGANVGFRGVSAAPELCTAKGASLVIGAGSFINSGVCLNASTRIELGRRCLLAEWVMIADQAFHEVEPGAPVRSAPIVIGDNVWLGVRAVVMPGVTIGDHTVVGAGAVVTKSLPDRCVAAGAPARVVRRFECADEWRRR